jgi:hypothetical protein
MTEFAELRSSLLEVLRTTKLGAQVMRLYDHETSGDQSDSTQPKSTFELARAGELDNADIDPSFIEDLRQYCMSSQLTKIPEIPPSERLPCANVDLEELKRCSDPGTKACSSCRLVSSSEYP